MNTGIMAAYEFDEVTDGWVEDSVPYVCIDHPTRPRIEGPHPEGTIYRSSGNFDLLLAPEANVKMYTKCDGTLCLVRTYPAGYRGRLPSQQNTAKRPNVDGNRKKWRPRLRVKNYLREVFW